jgi:hypothetical protein
MARNTANTSERTRSQAIRLLERYVRGAAGIRSLLAKVIVIDRALAMVGSTMNASLEKTAVDESTASPGARIGSRDVVRALQSAYARRLVLGIHRRAGYRAADFDLRRAARMSMVEALTAGEDALELRGIRRKREAIRSVRRALEAEVWR